MNDIVINRDKTPSVSFVNTTRRIYGSTSAFSSMLTDMSRQFRYFVIEEVNGNVQMQFTNTNPEQPR